jgi:hypothetical protein
MKQTITIGTAQFTLCVIDQRAFAPMSTETLMQNRITDIRCAVAKLKPRKPTVRADGRVYPRWGASASTADYVREYHLANTNRYNHDSVKEWIKGFYQPLSTHVTVPQGEDREELCLSGC